MYKTSTAILRVQRLKPVYFPNIRFQYSLGFLVLLVWLFTLGRKNTTNYITTVQPGNNHYLYCLEPENRMVDNAIRYELSHGSANFRGLTGSNRLCQCTENRIRWCNVPCIILLKLCLVCKGSNVYKFQRSFPMCFQGFKKKKTARNFFVILGIKIRAIWYVIHLLGFT